MPVARIGSGSGTITLSADEESRPAHVLCEVRAETLSVSRWVYALDFEDLAEFFERLATDWRGWTGSCAWRSLEGDLELTADHGGRVRLRVALRGDPFGADWHAATTIELEPGEELATVAADVRALVEGMRPTT